MNARHHGQQPRDAEREVERLRQELDEKDREIRRQAEEIARQRQQIADAEKQIEDAYQTLREMVPQKPYPSIDGFRTIIQDAAARIPAAKNANPRDFMDTSLLEELDRSGYIDALYR